MSLIDWMDVTEEEIRENERKLTEEKLRTGRVRNKCCGNCEHIMLWVEREEIFACKKFGNEMRVNKLKKPRDCWAWEFNKFCKENNQEYILSYL